MGNFFDEEGVRRSLPRVESRVPFTEGSSSSLFVRVFGTFGRGSSQGLGVVPGVNGTSLSTPYEDHVLGLPCLPV